MKIDTEIREVVTIEYLQRDRIEELQVYEMLEKGGYKITSAGPKQIGSGKIDITIGQVVAYRTINPYKERDKLMDILVNVTHHDGALEEFRPVWGPIVTNELRRRAQSVADVLSTPEGTKIMHPGYGVSVSKLLADDYSEVQRDGS